MIFEEPNAGVVFTNQTLLPVHVNKIVDNERAIFRTLVATRREHELASGVAGSTQGLAASWSSAAECWVNKAGTGLGAFTAGGAILTVGGGTSLGSEYVWLLSNDQANITQFEAWPATTSTDALVSTDFGATWTTLIASAALSGNVTDAPGLFIGGPNVVRLIPVHNGAGGTTLSMLAVSNTNTASIIALPSPTIGASSFRPRLAHDGNGNVAMVGCHTANIWHCTNYGTLAGYWNVSALPTISTTNGASIDYDDELGLWVVLQRRVTAFGYSELLTSTSANAADWQAWHALPFTWASPSVDPFPVIRCIGGIWFVLTWEARGAGTYDFGGFALWFSHDHGASWSRIGRVGVSRHLTAEAILDCVMEKTTDGYLGIVTGRFAASSRAVVTTFGPFTTATAV